MRTALVVETVAQAMVAVDRADAMLTEAINFQATRKIRSVAVAAATYAREAKDTRLLEKATTLRTRAERKAGQMLIEAATKGQRDGSGGDRKSSSKATRMIPKLADIGVTYDESSKWQKVGELTDTEFETALATTKAITCEISVPKVLRAVKGAKAREPEVIENDEPPAAIAPRSRTHAEQAVEFYNAMRALGEITCTARQLRAALPAYQHFRITESIELALALLQEVKRTWKN